MNNEIISIFEYMEKEKGISREVLIPAIRDAIKNAGQKGVNAGQELKVEINPKTGDIQAWTILRVVDSVSDPLTEVHISKAALYKENPQLGDVIEKEIHPGSLGRIAAQMVQQTIAQWVRTYEKERLYGEYKNMVGQLVSGKVVRMDKNGLIVDLGSAEALLPKKERPFGDRFKLGDHIITLIKRIDVTQKGTEIILSRSDNNFVRRMLEREVTELHDGSVQIVAIARDPGNRTKIAVDSPDPKIDPVGACVGSRGGRVRALVDELSGEKIDIIRYSPDPETMLREAIKPAVPRNIQIDPRRRRIYFEVAPDDMKVALGRGGRNAKLTAKLIGWHLDIDKLNSGEQHISVKMDAAATELVNTLGIAEDYAERLVSCGFTNLEALDGEDVEADLKSAGFSEEEIAYIMECLDNARGDA